MIKSGISVFDSRTARAITHVAHAGLIRRPKRAVNQITKRDLEVLQEHPDRVDSQMSSANLGPARELLKGVQYLRGRRAVITMSRFSPDAYSYAEKVAARVILIDGATLASLLVKHDIGAQNSETFVLKRNRAGQLVIPSALGALQRASAPRAYFGPLPHARGSSPLCEPTPRTFHRVQHTDHHPKDNTMTETVSPGARATADLYDEYGERLQSCDLQLRHYGSIRAFFGAMTTVKCFDDNVLLNSVLTDEDGTGRVLVIDGGGSVHSALMGDMIAKRALDNHWAGVIINGAVRDVATLSTLPIGVKALGSNPRKSGKTGAGERDVVVEFGGAVFSPGEMVYADDDGIVVVPNP